MGGIWQCICQAPFFSFVMNKKFLISPAGKQRQFFSAFRNPGE